MNGVTIIETKKLNALFEQMETMVEFVKQASVPVEPQKLMTISEVMKMTSLSRSSIDKYKSDIGYTTIGGCYRFKRKDVELYIEENYLSRKAS